MESEVSGRQSNQKLRRERELRGWSQRKVADEIGSTSKLVSRWESGMNLPDPYYRQKLCELFGKDANELGFILSLETVGTSIEKPIAQTPAVVAPQIAPWIPRFPQPFFAHPYPLQKNFTGRTEERAMLNTWWQKDEQPLLTFLAMGGMGKSSLTWVWMHQDLPNISQDRQPEGILWWSFYETDATFGLFLDQALIYTSNRTVNPQSLISIYEKIQTLVHILQQHRFLLVLDGFERLLRAYATPGSSGELSSFFRACIDPHIANFLRWLVANPLHSKIILTSRLAPRELDGMAHCLCIELSTLATEDALAFLQTQGVKGSRREMQSTCVLYGNHPLALRLLTGLIMHDPVSPGDITVAADYSPMDELVQREHHILALAYDALAPAKQQLLSQIAAFRPHVRFETLKKTTTFATQRELKEALIELGERGLLFIDAGRGYYDLHPVVRQYAYARLQQKETYHQRLVGYFQAQSGLKHSSENSFPLKKLRALLAPQDERADVEIFEGLTPFIELHYHTVQAKEYSNAFALFYSFLARPLYHRLGAYQLVIELLHGFFTQEDSPVESLERHQQSWLLDALANAYGALGYPQRAVVLLRASILMDLEQEDKESLAVAYWNLAVQQLVLGDLTGAEANLVESIAVCSALADNYNGVKSHQYFALFCAYQGQFEECWQHLETAFSLAEVLETPTLTSALYAYQALCKTLAGDLIQALDSAEQALHQANILHYERDIVRAKWLLGSTLARLSLQKTEKSAEQLQKAAIVLDEALERCRLIDMVDYEADILLACARLYYARGEGQQAKTTCMEALGITDRSDFRVLRADVLNFLAQLEWEEGNQQRATELANAALADALCNGIPNYYQSAFHEARRMLEKTNTSS